MASLRSPVVILAALLVAACAKSVPVTGNEGGTQLSTTTDVQRWSAPLRQLSMTSNPVLSGSGAGATAASYGSATLTQRPGSGRARYEVTITVPPAANRQLAWALFTGSCSTASPPVVPVNELPPIDLDAAGSGAARGDLPAELNPRTTYNLRVYATARATDVNNVVLCARLGYSGRK